MRTRRDHWAISLPAAAAIFVGLVVMAALIVAPGVPWWQGW